jgi:hypothetical protein
MSYQTGTSSGVTDLLDKLEVFAAAAGWTIDLSDATTLSLHKGAVYQNLFDGGTSIQMKGARGFSAGSSWDAQPTTDYRTQICSDLAGAFAAYHFFASANYIHVAVEVDPGMYRHFAFGELAKSSGYTGGQYSCATKTNGSSWSTALFSAYENTSNGADRFYLPGFFIDVDGVADWEHFNGMVAAGERQIYSSDSYVLLGSSVDGILYWDWLNHCTPNSLNGLTAFVPIPVFIERGSGFFSPLGYVRDIRLVNMVDLEPGQTVTLGSDEWLIFPALQKTVGTPNSGNWGYAYKKIP